MARLLPAITALGTSWHIELFDHCSNKKARLIFDQTVSFLENFNNSYSRFLPQSLLSQLNNERSLINPPHDLVTMLRLSQTWYQKTNGVFNIMVETELVRRGYDQTYSFHEKDVRAELLANPLTAIKITDDYIHLLAGRIDLGGLGKGYAIDGLSALLHSMDVGYFLINGGGDIYGTSNHGEAITIYLEHPLRTDIFLGETCILNSAFAASSPHKRQWRGQHGTHTHLIASSGVMIADATFVKAPTAVEADIIATASAVSESIIAGDSFAIARYDATTETLTHSSNFTPLTLYT
jgi:thiamine biosynthesis lipoprotein